MKQNLIHFAVTVAAVVVGLVVAPRVMAVLTRNG